MEENLIENETLMMEKSKETIDAENEAEIKQKLQLKMELEGQFKNGISWFYWIAGLSVMNTVIHLIGGNWNFIAGLGITQIIDGFITTLYGKEKIVAIFIDFLLAAFYVLLGYLARKGRNWIIILGAIFYSLDAIIFIIAQDWIGFGFHGLAIYGFIKAIIANKKLKKLNQQ